MGQISSKRIVVLIVLMALTAIAINLRPVSSIKPKKESLESVISLSGRWIKLRSNKIDQPIIDALYLDDYINQTYTDNLDTVSLYIGYYYSAKKIGAAHDPMVCFPGQGWKISDKKTGQITLKSGHRISYSTMIGQLGQERELITYWFQSFDITNNNTFSQKISLFIKKLMNQGEDNAFVRITMPIGSKPIDEYNNKTIDFINSFYPVFIKYIACN